MARTVTIKNLVTTLKFVDVDGEEVFDKTSTMAALAGMLEERAAEILEDEDTIKEFTVNYLAQHGKDGVSASVVPARFLVLALHTELGSLRDPSKAARNEKKIKSCLDLIGYSAGKGGFKLASEEEIAARKARRAANRATNKALREAVAAAAKASA